MTAETYRTLRVAFGKKQTLTIRMAIEEIIEFCTAMIA